MRHAYTFVNYKNHSVLVGQTWHPCYDGVFPNVLTLNGGTSENCSVLCGPGVNVADVIKTAASVEFNYKGFNVALECEYSNAAYAKYIETKLLEDYRVGNIRGVFRVTYSFNKTWGFASKTK